MAEFCRHDPPPPVVSCQIIAHQFFGGVIPVTFRRVNQIDAEAGGLVEDGVGLGLGVRAAPLAAELPGSKADDGDLQICFTEQSIAHKRS